MSTPTSDTRRCIRWLRARLAFWSSDSFVLWVRIRTAQDRELMAFICNEGERDLQQIPEPGSQPPSLSAQMRCILFVFLANELD